MVVLFADLMFVVATAIAWRPLSPLNLAGENNLATWWSAACLLWVAILAWRNCVDRQSGERIVWAVVAVVSVGLSFTEIGSIHERVGYIGPRWRPLGTAIATGFLVLIIRLAMDRRTRKTAALFLAAQSCFIIAGWLEHLEFARSWSPGLRGLRAAAEEGSELGASFLLLAGTLAAAQRKGVTVSELAAAGATVPGIGWLAFFGLAANVGVTAFGTAHLSDLPYRGNPSAWYPSALLLLCATMAFCSRNQSERIHRSRSGILAVLLLAGSLDAMAVHTWQVDAILSELRSAHSSADFAVWFAASSAGFCVSLLLWSLAHPAGQIQFRWLPFAAASAIGIAAILIANRCLLFLTPGVAAYIIYLRVGPPSHPIRFSPTHAVRSEPSVEDASR